MFRAKPDEGLKTSLVCRNKPAAAKGKANEANARACYRHLGDVSLLAVETGRILKEYESPSPNCISAWCRDCNRGTEYRLLIQLSEAA